MASDAYNKNMLVLLQDAEELCDAHSQLCTGTAGRQWKLGALNRAVVIMCVSAWESYLEELCIEAVTTIKPSGNTVSVWQGINAATRSNVGRFNNPNFDNTRSLIAGAIGLQDISLSWIWQNCTQKQAIDRLTEAMSFRHEIAHGVNPRPTIHNTYAKQLPGFFRKLAVATDKGVRSYLVNELAVTNPWAP